MTPAKRTTTAHSLPVAAWVSRMAFLVFLGCVVDSVFGQAPKSPFFRVELRDGVWWLARPQKAPIFSIGVNVVDPGHLPNDAKAPHYVGDRSYADRTAWGRDTLRRMESWGVNTIGAWSSEELRGGSLPETVALALGASASFPWNDAFHPRFAQEIDAQARVTMPPRAKDPQVLGWFSDNELAWYPEAIFAFHWTQSPQSATRQRLLAILNRHYKGDFAALQRDFTVSGARGFEDFGSQAKLTIRPGGSAVHVIDEFTHAIARQYYSVVAGAMRKYAPNHLYLGDRYMGYCPEPVARAAADFVDVVSTNYDSPSWTRGDLPRYYLASLHQATGRPVLVSEFYCAARENQSGNPNSFPQFTQVTTQRQRARVYGNRLRTLARLPYVVGAHWFCFADEPPGGRDGDGEDMNFGLIDIHNRPYRELTRTASHENLRAASLHMASRVGRALPAACPFRVPRAPTDPLGGLAEWNKSDGYLTEDSPFPVADLYVCRDDSHLYLGLCASDYVDDSLFPDSTVPRSELPCLTLHIADRPDISIRFGQGAATAEPSRNDHEIHYGITGVQHTLIVAIDATSYMGCAVVPLRATFDSFSRRHRMQWVVSLATADGSPTP